TRPELTTSWLCPRQGHIATQCPTTTTEIDASPSSLLRPDRQVLLSDERHGMILPRVMSHERQTSFRGWRRVGSPFRELVGGTSCQSQRRKHRRFSGASPLLRWTPSRALRRSRASSLALSDSSN